MALGVWQNTIRDSNGRTVPQAQVTVLDSDTQLPRDLFEDRDELTAMDNPFLASSAGFARCYSAVGRVDILIVAGTLTIQLKNWVLIDDFPG